MPARSSYKTYTVVSGDTLSKIAQRFGSSVQAIATASGVSNPNQISVGQQLLVPVAADDDLSEVQVTVKPIVSSSPKTPPRAGVPPTLSVSDYLAVWLEPPRLYGTIAVVLVAGYLLLTGKRRKS